MGSRRFAAVHYVSPTQAEHPRVGARLNADVGMLSHRSVIEAREGGPHSRGCLPDARAHKYSLASASASVSARALAQSAGDCSHHAPVAASGPRNVAIAWPGSAS